ncbi:hypothetical protein D3C85_1885000 [compost metagenome]
MDIQALGAGKDKGCPALGLHAQRLGTGQLANLVGPGTGGVDDDRRAEGLGVGLNLPLPFGITAQA